MKRYLKTWLSLSSIVLFTVAGLDLIVDPYGIFRFVDQQGFNQIKPTAGAHGAMSKAYQVLKVRPNALILGNSRAEVGLNPENSVWPEIARPVYNLALPGKGTRASLQYLQHVLEAQKDHHPKVVVWGLDFMDFLVDGGAEPEEEYPKETNSRLLTFMDGSQNPTRLFIQLRDYAETTFTLSALFDSAVTIRAQHDPYAQDLTARGFNPMRDYIQITSHEGYWAVFRQRDIENINAYSKRPKSIFDASGTSSPAMADLRRVIKLCREREIDLRLISYPYHAHLLTIISLTGHWPAFENWKRAIVGIAYTESINASLKPVPFWDFSLYNDYSQSAIPAKGDKKTTNPWYWEAGHYKKELGDLMLAQVFGQPVIEPRLGIRLSPTNVKTVIAEQRTLAQAYQLSHQQEVNDLKKLAVR
ncbi:MAG: hypothetical protein ACU836_07935 [Gammaproteobacteria bacterium]